MLDNTNFRQAGFTAVEILTALVIGGIILGTFFVFSFTTLSSTVRNANEAHLAVESQTILRSVTEELRVSSGIRSSNTIPDPNNSSGWTTSNPNLVLIISTPALDQSGHYLVNELEGGYYQNEIIYYANDGNLYKRILADSAATNNRMQTSCPAATSSCPQDILLSKNFDDMSFVFYDQDNQITNDPAAARSITVSINLEKTGYRQTTRFENKIRITMRNNVI